MGLNIPQETTENPQLTNVDALSGLETLGVVSFVDDDMLGHLPTFENVSTLGSLQVAENDILETGPYFPNVTEGGFFISDNRSPKHDGAGHQRSGPQQQSPDRVGSAGLPGRSNQRRRSA
jgi:hypothetical protein